MTEPVVRARVILRISAKIRSPQNLRGLCTKSAPHTVRGAAAIRAAREHSKSPCVSNAHGEAVALPHKSGKSGESARRSATIFTGSARATLTAVDHWNSAAQYPECYRIPAGGLEKGGWQLGTYALPSCGSML